MSKNPIDKLFKSVKDDMSDFLTIDVPVVADAAYDTSILRSNNLADLEQGIRAAKKVGDMAWYVIACALTKILDGGLYAQTGLSKDKYKLQIRARLGIDARKLSDFLTAGRFLVQHGQKLIDRGWQPEGMESKIRIASRLKKQVKSEAKVLDALMSKSTEDLREMLRKKKSADEPASTVTLTDGRVELNGKELLTIASDLPADIAQDIKDFVDALILSRSRAGRVACFAVETRRQAQNAPRIFADFTKGKFKKA